MKDVNITEEMIQKCEEKKVLKDKKSNYQLTNNNPTEKNESCQIKQNEMNMGTIEATAS